MSAVSGGREVRDVFNFANLHKSSRAAFLFGRLTVPSTSWGVDHVLSHTEIRIVKPYFVNGAAKGL